MEKKKSNYGLLSAILALIAVVFICISWGHIGKFGMPLCNSLGALITGIICLCTNNGKKVLAIIGIVVSTPALIISLFWLERFICIFI